MANLRSVIGVLFLIGLLSAVAPADEYHYRDVVMGERAVGMSGAFTAVADDASAAYYNPAGLAQRDESTLSLTATALQARMQSRGFLGKDVDGNDVSQTSLEIIASSWNYATNLWGGRFAFSILVPESSDFEMDAEIVTDQPGPNGQRLVYAHLIRQIRDTTYMGGPSYAYQVADNWFIGLSLFYFYRSFNHQQDDTYVYDSSATTQIVDNESGTSQGLQTSLGVIWHAHARLRFGLQMNLGFSAVDSGQRRRLRVESTPTSTDQFSRTVSGEQYGGPEGEEEIESKRPASATFGIAWLVTDDFLLSVDNSIYGGTEYQRLGRTITRETTWNLAIGGEIMLWEGWPLRFGFFTNRTSAPAIDKDAVAAIDPATYTREDVPPNHIDYYGGSLSLGSLSEHSTLDVALQMVIGSGETVEVLQTGAAVHPFADFSISLVISGSYIF